MALLDVFDSDAFSVHNLTVAVDKLPYMPARIGQLNLFKPTPVSTPIAIVEERLGTLSILPTMPRGSDGQTTQSGPRRKIRAIPIPHVPQFDTVLAGDLEGKRAFGSEDQTEVFSQILNDRFENMKQNHEATREYHRIGALKGIVLDADGATEVANWFTIFGLSQTEVNFNFYDAGDYDNADPLMDMKDVCSYITRLMWTALGATPFTGIHAMCGDNFFDDFIKHATVRRAYERFREGEVLRTSQLGPQPFEFGGIKWENYRGSVGGVDFVDTDEATFFPLGTPNLFQEVIAPADFVETVNTRGIPMYAKQERMKWDKGVELHTQSNILYMCTRPKVLIKGNRNNTTTGTTY